MRIRLAPAQSHRTAPIAAPSVQRWKIARKSTAAALMARAKARLTSWLSMSEIHIKYPLVRFLVYGTGREM